MNSQLPCPSTATRFGEHFAVFPTSPPSIPKPYDSTADKYNTIIVKKLPGTWFGLNEDLSSWQGSNSNSNPNPNSTPDDFTIAGTPRSLLSTSTNHTHFTTSSLKTREPFIKLLKKLFSAYGAVKHLDAVLYEEDESGCEVLPNSFSKTQDKDDASVSTLGSSISTRKTWRARAEPQTGNKMRLKTNQKFRKSMEQREFTNILGSSP